MFLISEDEQTPYCVEHIECWDTGFFETFTQHIHVLKKNTWEKQKHGDSGIEIMFPRDNTQWKIMVDRFLLLENMFGRPPKYYSPVFTISYRCQDVWVPIITINTYVGRWSSVFDLKHIGDNMIDVQRMSVCQHRLCRHIPSDLVSHIVSYVCDTCSPSPHIKRGDHNHSTRLNT